MRKELKIISLIAGALALLLFALWLGFGALQLHYSRLRLQNELVNLRRDPLLKIIPEENDVSELETLRVLAETGRLDFLSSKSGEDTLELALRGAYPDFLEYLRALDTGGEIIQLDLSAVGGLLESRIMIKGVSK